MVVKVLKNFLTLSYLKVMNDYPVKCPVRENFPSKSSLSTSKALTTTHYLTDLTVVHMLWHRWTAI